MFISILFLPSFVIAKENINKIDLNVEGMDTIDDSYTGVEAEMTISYSGRENSHVSNGNNKSIYQCPTSTKCLPNDESLKRVDSDKLMANHYTYVELEIFADEYGNELENPSYDFDKDNLENIEVWINGTKRDDIVVNNYNQWWRMVHVFVPITVKKHIESSESQYLVTFNTNGGNNIDSQSIAENGIVLEPANPVKEGYEFVGWYKDSSLTESYNFDDSVTSNLNLYAKWNQILTSAGAHITIPVRGKNAPMDIKSDDESKYTVKIDYWYLSDKEAGYPHVSEDEILKPGKTYRLRFKFIPKDGYVFNDRPYTTLNGKETKKYGLPSSCEYTFFIKDQLSQINASTNSIKLEWEKNSEAKGYIVQVKSGKKWKAVKSITKNTTTTLTIKKLKAGTKYTYRIQSYKMVKKKKKIINTTNDLVAITTPKNPKVTLSIKDYNAMNINIKSVKGAYSYAVEKSTDGKSYILFNRVYNPTTISQEGLEVGKTYYYRVQACNANGYCSKWATVKKTQTTKTPSFSLNTSKNKVTITINTVNEADGYEAYRSTKKNGKYKLVKCEGLTIDNTTKKGIKYYYKVRSYKIVGGKKIYSPYSKVKSIKSK